MNNDRKHNAGARRLKGLRKRWLPHPLLTFSIVIVPVIVVVLAFWHPFGLGIEKLIIKNGLVEAIFVRSPAQPPTQPDSQTPPLAPSTIPALLPSPTPTPLPRASIKVETTPLVAGGQAASFWLVMLKSNDHLTREVYGLVEDTKTTLFFKQWKTDVPPGGASEQKIGLWEPEFTKYGLIVITPLTGYCAEYLRRTPYDTGKPYNELTELVENRDCQKLSSRDIWFETRP